MFWLLRCGVEPPELLIAEAEWVVALAWAKACIEQIYELTEGETSC